MDALGDLERWAADARAREAADARTRQRWLRTQAEEDASLAGVLACLAERAAAVVVTTIDGHHHRGVLSGVGVDFCALTAPGGALTLVALMALADVRTVGANHRPVAAAEAGRASLGVHLIDVLAQAAGQRPRITVHAATAPVAGDLRAVGADVITMHIDGAGVAYVRLASVSAVSFLASG